MSRLLLLILLLSSGIFFSCNRAGLKISRPLRDKSKEPTGGEKFYVAIQSASGRERDSMVVKEILTGNFPSFMRRFVKLKSSIMDSLGIRHEVEFFVSPDYLSVGTDFDFVRVSITPMAAQKIADSFDCFLPTKKLVDLVYEQANLRMLPVPMYIFRDSSVSMWQHHLVIEGQRRSRKGLISGIKKDIVTSIKLLDYAKRDRVAIYGWHMPGGKPIQPLYTGHVNWYVDYSHGIRLVARRMRVDGKFMDYTDVMNHPTYHRLITDEIAGVVRYPY